MLGPCWASRRKRWPAGVASSGYAIGSPRRSGGEGARRIHGVRSSRLRAKAAAKGGRDGRGELAVFTRSRPEASLPQLAAQAHVYPGEKIRRPVLLRVRRSV